MKLSGYPGRVAGAGLTHDGDPFFIYAVTFLTHEDRQRRAHWDAVRGKLHIVRTNQEASMPIEYRAAIHGKNKNQIAIGNGDHTEKIIENAGSIVDTAVNMREIFRNHSLVYEATEKGVPRIAAYIGDNSLYLAKMTTNYKPTVHTTILNTGDFKGRTLNVSTYVGETREIEITDDPAFFYLYFRNVTPEEIAKELRAMFDPGLFVAAAVGIYNKHIMQYDVATQNVSPKEAGL